MLASSTIASETRALPPGEALVRFDFESEGGRGPAGLARIFVNGEEVARGRIPQTLPMSAAGQETFSVGRDSGTPVIEDYEVPFPFTGELQSVTVDLR